MAVGEVTGLRAQPGWTEGAGGEEGGRELCETSAVAGGSAEEPRGVQMHSFAGIQSPPQFDPEA